MAFATPNVFGTLLTNMIIAIIILLLGFVVGKMLGSALNKIFLTLSFGKKVKKGKNNSFAKGFSSLISLCTYIIAVILALQQLGITLIVLKAVLAILLIFVLGATLFASIDFLMNLFFGIKILTSKKFKKGDTIKIKKIEGTIQTIKLSHTRLKTKSGDTFIIPNRLFFKRKYSKEIMGKNNEEKNEKK
ncbi:MAG: mechanosensitive ion channel domain-containing protein [Candidatus Woesearchaeota archaeon]|jgi:small-conductance mechanosensitive channel